MTKSKFGMLRRILGALGLSQQATDDAVDFIADLLTGEGKNEEGQSQAAEFPYHQRDHFLSPAELSFYGVLRTVVGTKAALSAKVALGDIFWVKHDDPSRFRTYTNKIDRKHVDFLVCEPTTMRPLVAIELDDKSHQRKDRQDRDAYVDQVFQAAGLPLLHVKAQRGYVAAELANQLTPYLGAPDDQKMPVPEPTAVPDSGKQPTLAAEAPQCPKCGSTMVKRTAKTGRNAGSHFWGCPNFPTCRSMLPYDG